MKIQSMFQKDIDRDINGVIKVSQDDQQSLKQELSEYIITKELRRHFATFFDNYVKAIDNPTDKIGVWISGFFGSGKSHFLNTLFYSCGLLNSCVSRLFLRFVSPTLDFNCGYVRKIPYGKKPEQEEKVTEIVRDSIQCSRLDWDSYETSWDFKRNPLV